MVELKTDLECRAESLELVWRVSCAVGSMTPVSWLRDFTIRILEEQIEDIMLQLEKYSNTNYTQNYQLEAQNKIIVEPEPHDPSLTS